ncbi:hypothetical protein [Streptomyces glomeratus]|uniref:Secreted protein n=1 Tax=Streptomyces glomeratus TaxID=284452 RepID=A0ABP6M1R6_9ACTN|nr:hypothetical protein [Streptomyces glomeratus]MCF1506770.1 hypothetical protein [Streptomyces glomeratus]
MKARATTAKPLRRRLIGTAALAAAGALTWVTLLGGGASAGQGTASETVAPAAGEAPGYAVENFGYPQADKILAERNIVLKRGDGHITLADCASGTGFLEVWARSKDKVCFQVTGNAGWLTLEIPSVYAVRGNDYAAQVDMTVGTEEKSFDVAKNTWTAVGESADPQGREHMLVEIRTSK